MRELEGQIKVKETRLEGLEEETKDPLSSKENTLFQQKKSKQRELDFLFKQTTHKSQTLKSFGSLLSSLKPCDSSIFYDD